MDYWWRILYPHGAIDDATGEILALYFTPNECMEGYFEIIRQIVTNHGIPIVFTVIVILFLSHLMMESCPLKTN